jgi:hypothetical protein
MWGANPRAVDHAATLIGLKYGCEVERRGWAQRSAAPDQWIRHANPGDPGDVASLTIWPDPPCTSVNDSIVLELRQTPGSFIGANDQAIPVSRVQEALRCPSLELARIWMRVRRIPDEAVQPRWRSVALAEEDQRRAVGDRV